MIKEKKMTKERRRSPRAKCDFIIEIESQKSMISANAVNISSSGMYLRCDHPISLFREIGVGIKLPGIEKLIECIGVVVRSEKETGKDTYNIAIFFEDIESEDKELLNEYVEKHMGG